MNWMDAEAEAKRRMLPAAYDYFAGGALDEVTVESNRKAFSNIDLLPRVLHGVTTPDAATSICGTDVSFPVLVSPTAFHGLAHPDGETATAAAANEAGTIMTLSTTATCSPGDVVAACNGGPVWFELYLLRDRGVSEDLVRAAEAAGCKAIVLTVDVSAWGRRERDMRNQFSLPKGMIIRSLLLPDRSSFHDGRMDVPLGQFINERFKFDLSWSDLEWLLGVTRLPVLVKGVVRPDDALRCADMGAAGIFVSNHGGRQLDGCVASLDALPGIVEAIAGRIPIIVDGGVRRGTDVFKAIALGATAAAVGRPIIWSLAVGGQAGVRQCLETIKAEFLNTMTLCGCRDVGAISRDLIARRKA